MLPYNDVAAVRGGLRRADGDEIAAVITEAAAGNMGVVAPRDGFNAGAARIAHAARRAADHRRGDDRLPGVAAAGWDGLDPVDADLFTFGKVMGGGLPAAAFGGRAEVMARLAPAGPVYQAGTLSGTRSPARPGWPRCAWPTPTLTGGSTRPPTTVGQAGHRGADRRRGAAPALHRRQHVLDLLHRRATSRDYDTRPHPGRRGVHGVLPRDADPRRLPAAQRLRGVVRLHRARRRRAGPDRRRPAARRPGPRPRPAGGGS